MATLGSVIGIVALATGGKKDKTTPPIQASSSDEEKFIKYAHPLPHPPPWVSLVSANAMCCREFIAKAEAESAAATKAKH
jgi:hypothetical protein